MCNLLEISESTECARYQINRMQLSSDTIWSAPSIQLFQLTAANIAITADEGEAKVRVSFDWKFTSQQQRQKSRLWWRGLHWNWETRGAYYFLARWQFWQFVSLVCLDKAAVNVSSGLNWVKSMLGIGHARHATWTGETFLRGSADQRDRNATQTMASLRW